MKKILSLLAVAVTGAVLGGPALAEDQPGQMQGSQDMTAAEKDGVHSGKVTDDELENYAEVKEAIKDIEQETQEAIADLGPDDENRQNQKQLLLEEKKRLVTEAIVDEGFTTQRFSEIDKKLQSDPELKRRLEEIM